MNNPSTCPHFIQCSGCTLGADWSEPPVWKQAKEFFKRYRVQPKLFSSGFEKTRLKAKLAVRFPFKIGLFLENSHEVLSIPQCKVHHPKINETASIVKKALEASKESVFCEKTKEGNVRYIQVFVQKKTGKVQLTIVLKEPPKEEFIQALLKEKIWHSVWLNFHNDESNRVLGESWERVFGDEYLYQTILGVEVAFHPAAFSQVHLNLFEKLIQDIDAQVPSNKRILELYAGVGVIGLVLQKKAKSVHLIENNPYAHLSFKESSKNIQNITYECIDAAKANLDADVFIVDPPRKGLDESLLKAISEKEGLLIYVSCNFESFQKDAVELVLNEWRIVDVKGYLLFPGTNHVEIVATFKK